MEGRTEPTMEDLHALIGPVLKHRMALNYQARTDGVGIDEIIKSMLQTVANA